MDSLSNIAIAIVIVLTLFFFWVWYLGRQTKKAMREIESWEEGGGSIARRRIPSKEEDHGTS